MEVQSGEKKKEKLHFEKTLLMLDRIQVIDSLNTLNFSFTLKQANQRRRIE